MGWGEKTFEGSYSIKSWREGGSSSKIPLPRRSNLQLEYGPYSNTIVIELTSLEKELYRYFPFLVRISVDGRVSHYFEVEKEWQKHRATITVPFTDTGKAQIEIISELGGSRKGEAGAGSTELALEILHMSSEVRQADKRSGFLLESGATTNRGFLDHVEATPIFVIGSYRSGTSIATWTLGQHPNISAIEETNWLNMLYLAAGSAFELSLKGSGSAPEIYELSKEDFLRWQGWAIDRLYQELKETRIRQVDAARLAGMDQNYDPLFSLRRSPLAPKHRWVDGTPEHTGMAMGLAQMFPRAQFIFMLRHPRQVIRSLMKHSNAGGIDQGASEAVQTWETMSKNGYELQTRLGPSRVKITPYEALRERPEELIEEWFQFLDEPAYPQAALTLQKTINSSGDTSEIQDSVLEQKEWGRLEALYDGMLAGKAFDQLPWKDALWPFEAREKHFSSALKTCLGWRPA